MEALLLQTAERIFASHEHGEALWRACVDAGLADALVNEARGGAGLKLAQFFALARAAGAHGVPLPLCETAMLRALCEAAPEGPIAIASVIHAAEQGWHAPRVPQGAEARYLAARIEGRVLILPLADAIITPHGMDTDITLPLEALSRGIPLPPDCALAEIGALAQAARLAGALARALAMALEHANTRTQFGRPIAAFQAIQHQLAELAEGVQLASLAAEMGFAGGIPAQGSLLAALAKARTSALAARGAAIAHAVHGAMGIAAEFPLGHVTSALHGARLAHGSESVWHERLGAALLASNLTSADFIDAALTPPL